MKKWLACLMFVLYASTYGLSAETVRQKPFETFEPRVVAQGGSRTAVAEGYFSLFSNPAGFANGDGDVTLLSSSFWMHGDPEHAADMARLLKSGDGSDSLASLGGRFTGQGFGFGASLGMGYVRKGLGLGFTAAFDEYYQGPSFPEHITGLLTTEFSLIGGYAVPLHIGWLTMAVGADVRPLVRVYAPLDNTASARMIHYYFGVDAGDGRDPFKNTYALNGTGVAVDAGLLAEAGPFTFGFALRDIFDTQLRYSWNSLADVRSSIRNWGLPAENSILGTDYIIPMSMSLGLAFRPDFGDAADIIDPVVHCEWYDPFGALDDDGIPEPSFLDRLRFGVETRIFRRLRLWGGWNRGGPSFGAGLRLSVVEIGCAYFSREIVWNSEYHKVTGITLNFSLRL